MYVNGKDENFVKSGCKSCIKRGGKPATARFAQYYRKLPRAVKHDGALLPSGFGYPLYFSSFRHGKGFSRSSLICISQFYLCYQKGASPSHQFTKTEVLWRELEMTLLNVGSEGSVNEIAANGSEPGATMLLVAI